MAESFVKKYNNDVFFLPLGGSGEIGMNLNMYCQNGKWLIVDYGAGFAEDYLPGIDMIVPDIEFIRRNQKDIVGLILTHAHEDHIGGIAHIWENFTFPIYASPFTAAFLKEKLADAGVLPMPEIIVTEAGERIKVGPFDVECVQLTHSTPEMHALFIRTPKGNIFHTGDWKFDPDPVAGAVTDMDKLRRLGDEGVLIAVGDSTNVFSEGVSGSEGDLTGPLEELVRKTKGMAIVTTFASNVGRMETLMRVAHNSGRKAVMSGRSLWRIYRAACSVGYFKDVPEPLTDKDLRSLAKKDVLAIVTGCQGEPLAAMSKIVSDSHPTIRIGSEDAVIFSSKIIPGNDKRIHRMINRLILRNITVYTEAKEKVHVSGHPKREEMRHLYSLLRPKIVIPVHGEDMHLREHALFATGECKVKKALRVHNGDVVRIADGDAAIIEKIPVGILGIDGTSLLPPDSAVLKMRRRMVQDGVVCILLCIEQDTIKPVVMAPGLMDDEDDVDLLASLQRELETTVAQTRSRKRGGALKDIEQALRSVVRRFTAKELGKNPPVAVRTEYM
jgi:ribonuclease J